MKLLQDFKKLKKEKRLMYKNNNNMHKEIKEILKKLLKKLQNNYHKCFKMEVKNRFNDCFRSIKFIQ
jgi:hypothetical protein